MTQRWRLVLLAAIIAILSAAVGFGVHQWQRTRAAMAAPAAAADFTLPDLASKPRRLTDYRGKLVLVNFWATWCPPCREEIPGFIRLHKRYSQQGFEILGISVDNAEAVARYWQEVKIAYPLLLADDSVFALMKAYGNPSGSLPFSVLVAPDGQVVTRRLGVFHESQLDRLILANLPRSTNKDR